MSALLAFAIVALIVIAINGEKAKPVDPSVPGTQLSRVSFSADNITPIEFTTEDTVTITFKIENEDAYNGVNGLKFNWTILVTDKNGDEFSKTQGDTSELTQVVRINDTYTDGEKAYTAGNYNLKATVFAKADGYDDSQASEMAFELIVTDVDNANTAPELGEDHYRYPTKMYVNKFVARNATAIKDDFAKDEEDVTAKYIGLLDAQIEIDYPEFFALKDHVTEEWGQVHNYADQKINELKA